jgi:predicted metal-dependent HD superfamily phosphohydrolase
LDKDDPLLSRWRALWQRLGVDDASLDDTGSNLLAAYSSAGRFYHSRKHLEDVFEKLDWAKTALIASGDLAEVPPEDRPLLFDTIELALWYHDAVYDPKQKDNEAKSRDLFLADAMRYGLPENLRTAAARLIDITASHKKAASLSEKVLCDCDLSILGAPKEAFSEYDANIRKEYAHVPEAAYKTARRHVLGGFLRQKPIFRTKAFQNRFEAQARQNLENAAQPLIAWLKSLFKGPAPP